MGDMQKLNPDELEQVAGGKSGGTQALWKWVTVVGTKNYLAIRRIPEYDYYNEIGKLYNGDRLQIRPDIVSGDYVWATANKIEGWVNGKYVK